MRSFKINRSLSLGLIGLLLGFPQMSETIYTPSLPDLAHGLHVGEEWAEFTLSIYFIGFAIGVFFWGLISDWLGRRPAMLCGIVLYTLGSWGCFQSQHIFSLLAWRFIQAYGASVGSVVTQTMIRDVYTGARRNQIFSIVGAILALSPAIGPFLGGWIDEIAGWRSNFAFLIGMGGVLLVYTFIRLPETKPMLGQQRISLGQVIGQFLQDSRVLGYALLVGTSSGIVFSYYAEAPFLFIELLHFTPMQYGLTGIVIAGASVLASFISHRLNFYEIRHERIILIGCALMGSAAIGLTLFAYAGMFREVTLIHLVAILGFISLLFLGWGLMIPNALSQCLMAYQSSIGTAGALFGLLYYILIASLTFLMGVLHNGTALPMPLYFLILIGLMFFVLYTLILPKKILSSAVN